MRDTEAEFRRRNARIVVVTFEAGPLAREYARETSLPWPILVDDSRETYRAYGMLSASFWDIWGPGTWRVYLREILKGARLRKSEGDVAQRGGDVLIDPQGNVALHHVGAGPADRPPVRILLETIDRG